MLTAEEEWNSIYNPKRCSIEALDSIIISKRGKGPCKPHYSSTQIEQGPYYDPQGIHLHIWKNKKLISNFHGEQNQNVPYIQFTDDKPGYYCSICHARNRKEKFNWVQCPEKDLDTPENIKYETFSDIHKYHKENFPVSENLIIKKWDKLMYKVLHVLKFNKLEYKVSNTKILYMWPWELTPFQKFKLKYPDYKDGNIFLNNKDMNENYAYII